MAVQSDVMEAAGPYDRARALNAFKLGDVTFYWITRGCAISVLLILGGIILSLIAVAQGIASLSGGASAASEPENPSLPHGLWISGLPPARRIPAGQGGQMVGEYRSRA